MKLHRWADVKAKWLAEGKITQEQVDKWAEEAKQVGSGIDEALAERMYMDYGLEVNRQPKEPDPAAAVAATENSALGRWSIVQRSREELLAEYPSPKGRR